MIVDRYDPLDVFALLPELGLELELDPHLTLFGKPPTLLAADRAIPTRPRTDHNPLNRKEYLLHVARRSSAKGDAHVRW